MLHSYNFFVVVTWIRIGEEKNENKERQKEAVLSHLDVRRRVGDSLEHDLEPDTRGTPNGAAACPTVGPDIKKVKEN